MINEKVGLKLNTHVWTNNPQFSIDGKVINLTIRVNCVINYGIGVEELHVLLLIRTQVPRSQLDM